MIEPQISEDLEVALRQLNRMSVLSHRLLGLAQIDSGEFPPTERMSLQQFLEDVGRSRAASATRTWHISCPEDAESRTDPAWLGLAATHCVIRVSDDGPGIADKDLDHMFKRFWHRLPPNGRWAAVWAWRWPGPPHMLAMGNNDRGGATFELSISRLVDATDRARRVGRPRGPSAGAGLQFAGYPERKRR